MTRAAEPLIPRRTLFDNPTFVGAKISPDGRWICWLAPVDGVLNVWMSPADDIKAASPVTRTKGRPINWQDWSADGSFLMFLNDESGDENRHLFVVDPATHAMRDVTPFANVNVVPTLWSKTPRATWPSKSMTATRDGMISIDRSSDWSAHADLGKHATVGHIGLDWQLRPRYASSNAPDGGSKLWRVEERRCRLGAMCPTKTT